MKILITPRLNIPVIGILVFLALIQVGLGVSMIATGFIYNLMIKWAVFEMVWLAFGISLIIVSMIYAGSPLNQFRRLSRNDMIAFGMVIGILMFSTLLFSRNQTTSMYYSSLVMLAVLVGLGVAGLTAKFGEGFVVGVCWALFVGTVLVIVPMAWFQVLEAGNSDIWWTRMGVPGYNNIRFYNFVAEVAIALGTGLFFFVSRENRFGKIAIFLGVVILWATMFWTGSRGGIVSLIVAAVITTVIVPRTMLRMFPFLIITAVLGAGLSVLYDPPYTSFGLFNIYERTFEAETANQMSSKRLALWQDAWGHIQRNPLFGYGMGQLVSLTRVDSFKIFFHPHNIILDTLLTVGVIGAMFYFYLLGRIWFSAISVVRRVPAPYIAGIFLALNTLFAHSMLAGPYFFIHSRIIFAILIGMILASIYARSKNTIS